MTENPELRSAEPAVLAVEVIDEKKVIPAAPAGPRVTTSAGSLPASVHWRELLAVLLWIVLADLVIYRGYGLAGYAFLFLAAPAALAIGSPLRWMKPPVAIVGVMLLVLAVDLVWCGSWPSVFVGFVLLVSFAAALAGLRPYVLDVIGYAVQAIPAGAGGLIAYGQSPGRINPRVTRVGLLSVILPLAALIGFGTLFVLANPDLTRSFADYLSWFFNSIGDWIRRLAPTWQEVLLWFVAAWLAAGLLRPQMRRSIEEWLFVTVGLAQGGEHRDVRELSGEKTDGANRPIERRSSLYPAFRNMLAAVIVLFAVYLVFEYQTLWFRVFPKGFYYAGYAHEGSAWLTAALALATLLLSVIFRGPIFNDPRLPQLKRLAWVWSAENMILAAAVYNRLHIYVDFNGMTRMRTVGLFGMSAVVVGFILVVRKIVCGHDVLWLFRRHLWTLAIAIYLFAVTPVDWLVHRYNVGRILAGDLAPSVQISVHPISSAGILVLSPLLECDDAIIREGIRAMLAERALKAEAIAETRQEQGWTSFQLADRLLLEQLRANHVDWCEYADPAKRSAAFERFRAYAYQWY